MRKILPVNIYAGKYSEAPQGQKTFSLARKCQEESKSG